MKKKMRNGFALLLAAMTVLALIGCESKTTGSDDAVLSKVTIGGVTATLGEPKGAWSDVGKGEVLLTDGQMSAGIVTASARDSKATIYMGKSFGDMAPTLGKDTSFVFYEGEVLTIQVVAEDGTKLFYKIDIKTRVAGVANLVFNGLTLLHNAYDVGTDFGTLAGPGDAWNSAGEGEVWFDKTKNNEVVNISVAAQAPDTSTVTVAVAAADAEPQFAVATQVTPVNGQYLYVKVEESVTTTTVYYKFKLIAKSTDRTITAKLNGVVMDIGNMGSSFVGDWSGMGAYTAGSGAELAATGNKSTLNITPLSSFTGNYKLEITIKDSASTIIDYVNTTLESNHIPNYPKNNGNYTGLVNGEYIGVGIMSEIGLQGWYRFRIFAGNGNTNISLVDLADSDAKAKLGTPGTITTDTSNGNTFSGQKGNIILPIGYTGVITAILDEKSSAGATIKYAAGTTSGFSNVYGPPDPAAATNTDGNIFPASITGAVSVWVLVTAEDTFTQAAYGFDVYTLEGLSLTSLQVGGQAATLGMAGSNWGSSPADGSITIYSTSAVVAATLSSFPNAKAEAGISIGGAEPTWAAVSSTARTFADQDVLGIKVSSGTYPAKYYKVKVTVIPLTIDDAKLDTLSIGGSPYPLVPGINVPAVNFGTPATTAAGVTAPGAVTLDAATAAGITGYGATSPTVAATVTLSSAGAEYRIAKTTGGNPAPAAWQGMTTVDYGFGPILVPPAFEPISNNDVLWFEVKAGPFTNIYKIVATVTPAP